MADDQTSANGEGEKSYYRHTPHQIQRLEEFYKECSHPNGMQRLQLCKELGLDDKRIKVWFRNKRTQIKAQGERADTSSLRRENEKYMLDNISLKEGLENMYCSACGSPSVGEEERRLAVEKLKMENVQLKQEFQRISSQLPDFMRNPLGVRPLSLADAGESSNSAVQNQSNGRHSIENSIMIDTAVNAISELLSVLQVDEPFWIKSLIEGGYVLHPETYSKLSGIPCHFKRSATPVESTKECAVISMDPTELLKMFADPDKWVDLFPTTVTKARTIEVLDTRRLGDHAGSLQLMYQQMHILSPLVGPREFYFLRYCGMVESCLWVMVDVSYDWSGKDPQALPLRAWKLPSGCLIRDKGHGFCEVTWLEEVKVEDSFHRLYRDLICGATAFGAQRWVATLLRMSERLAAEACSPSNELGEAIYKPEGWRSIMNLSQRMVKTFCGILSMTDRLDLPEVSEMNNSAVHISVRQSSGENGQHSGTIVIASASLWLPQSCRALFDFFRDENMRAQWDVLYNGSIAVANISCGTKPGNCISITKAIVPDGTELLMLQESCIDPSGSLVVFSPVDFSATKLLAMEGGDSTRIPLLPSGFVISPDGRPDKGKSAIGASTTSSNNTGSLLTLAFQILVGDHLEVEQLMESVAVADTLVRSTIEKIRTYFGCPDVDQA